MGLVDHAGHVGAHSRGKGKGYRITHETLDRFPVDGIDARGPYGNSNLPMSGRRGRRVDYP